MTKEDYEQIEKERKELESIIENVPYTVNS